MEPAQLPTNTQNGHQIVMNFGRRKERSFRKTEIFNGAEIKEKIKIETDSTPPSPHVVRMSIFFTLFQEVFADFHTLTVKINAYIQQHLDNFTVGDISLHQGCIITDLHPLSHRPVKTLLDALDAGRMFDMIGDMCRESGVLSLIRGSGSEVKLKLQVPEAMLERELDEIEGIETARHEVGVAYRLLNTEEGTREETWDRLQRAAKNIEVVDKKMRSYMSYAFPLSVVLTALALKVFGSEEVLIIGILCTLFIFSLKVYHFNKNQKACKDTKYIVNSYIYVIKVLNVTLDRLGQIRERNCPGVTELLPNIRNGRQRQFIKQLLNFPDSVVVNPEYITIEKESEEYFCDSCFGFLPFLFRDFKSDPLDTGAKVREIADKIEEFELLETLAI